MSGLTTRMAPASAGVGTHEATLVDIDPIKGQFGGPAWRWDFRTADGKRLPTTTGTLVAKDTHAGQLAEQAFGREIGADEEVDLADLIGRKFLVTAVPGRDGGVIVRKVEPLKK